MEAKIVALSGLCAAPGFDPFSVVGMLYNTPQDMVGCDD
jgi:hypothetical protein